MSLSKLISWGSEWVDSLYELACLDPGRHLIPVALAVTSGLLGAWVVWRTYRGQRRRLPPSSRCWPIIGNTRELTGDLHLDLLRIQRENKLPDIFTLQLGFGKKMIILNSYDVAKDAFVTQGDMFAGRPKVPGLHYVDMHDDIFQKDFLDPTWKQGKSFIMSALRSFGFGSNKNSEEKILEQTQLFLDFLDTKVGGSGVELTGILREAAANVLFRILFNKSYNLGDPELVSRIKAVHDWYKAFPIIIYLERFPEWFARLFLGSKIRCLLNATEGVRSFIRQEIEEHAQTVDPENPRDFVDLYLTQNPIAVDKERLTNTAFAFMPDGIDSVASLVDWVMLYVVYRPNVMKKIQEEVESVTGGNRLVRWEDRPLLPYTEAVIMESIRMACPVALSAVHCAIQDCYFRGYFIPKGVMVKANMYAVMMDPDNFENPEEFRPERFLDENNTLIKTDLWIPFGMGRRRCVGEQTSKTEAFLFVANLLQRYDFEFSPENREPPLTSKDQVVRTPQPYKVVLKLRN